MRSFQQSKNIVVDFARQTDDEALKELLRDMPMPGDISIAFGREPSFFRSACVEGKDTAVFVGRTQENEIIGMGTRSEKHGYVNGQLVCFGYLSDLRLKPEYRSLSLLGRGFRLLRRFIPAEMRSCIWQRSLMRIFVLRKYCFQVEAGYLLSEIMESFEHSF